MSKLYDLFKPFFRSEIQLSCFLCLNIRLSCEEFDERIRVLDLYSLSGSASKRITFSSQHWEEELALATLVSVVELVVLVVSRQ